MVAGFPYDDDVAGNPNDFPGNWECSELRSESIVEFGQMMAILFIPPELSSLNHKGTKTQRKD